MAEVVGSRAITWGCCMARIEGEGLKDGRRYRAYQTMGEGLYRVIDEGADEPQPSDSVRVAIPRKLVRKLAPLRLPDETLSKQLQSIIEQFLQQGTGPFLAGRPRGGARTPDGGQGGEAPGGSGGAQRPTPGSALGAAGTAFSAAGGEGSAA